MALRKIHFHETKGYSDAKIQVYSVSKLEQEIEKKVLTKKWLDKKRP